MFDDDDGISRYIRLDGHDYSLPELLKTLSRTVVELRHVVREQDDVIDRQGMMIVRILEYLHAESPTTSELESSDYDDSDPEVSSSSDTDPCTIVITRH